MRNSVVYLAKNIKLEKNYNNVLKYSEQDMINLITNENNLVYSSNNFSFIRENNEIKVEVPYEIAIQSNYIAFQNPDYSNKWFFAFVDKIEYISNKTCKILFTVDLFSTWWSYWTPQACYVLREHVADDSIGLHTVPEDVDTGDYIVDFEKTLTALTPYKIVMGTTVDYYIDSQTGTVNIIGDNGGGIYGGIKSAYKYYYFESNQATSKLGDVLKAYASAGKSDAIGMLFIAPTYLIEKVDETVIDDGDVKDTYSPTSMYWNNGSSSDLYRPFNLDGYVPKNKKLLCYPYCYLLMSNNNGGNVIYNYEYFEISPSSNYAIDFLISGVLTPSMSGVIAPLLYKGLGVNYSESLQLPKYPICGWLTDIYTNWLTQQGMNNNISIMKSTTTGAIGGGATGMMLGPIGGAVGALLGGVGGALTSTANIALDMHNHEFIPPQANGNTNTGDVSVALNRSTFTAYGMCVKREFATIIDSYLSRVGYKVNTIKVPNMEHRENFNYIQIGNSETLCYTNNYNGIMIPASDLNTINEMFKKGITLWNNHNNLGDYSVSNNITN